MTDERLTARLGSCAVHALDDRAQRRRELFEGGGHAACLLPISVYPLVRARMHIELSREYMTAAHDAYIATVYAGVGARAITVDERSTPG